RAREQESNMDLEDKIRLSAMFDGEATDLEERRFFRDHAPADSALELARWEAVRQALRGRQPSFISDTHQVALFESIHEAIAKEPSLAPVSEPKTTSRRRPMAFAAAASVLLMVGVALMVPELQDIDSVQNRDGVAMNALGDDARKVRDPARTEVLSVALDPSKLGTNELDEVDTNPDLRALDAAGRAKLRAYLQQHDRVSQSGSRQAFVNYPNPRDGDQ
ncbi:MAG: hypothetical protein ACPH91_12305, partial [Pseudomonadales bacterium]